jgi:hypothetical protein
MLAPTTADAPRPSAAPVSSAHHTPRSAALHCWAAASALEWGKRHKARKEGKEREKKGRKQMEIGSLHPTFPTTLIDDTHTKFSGGARKIKVASYWGMCLPRSTVMPSQEFERFS